MGEEKVLRSPTTQELIVRQSCVKAAVELNKTKEVELLLLAESLESWCWRKK